MTVAALVVCAGIIGFVGALIMNRDVSAQSARGVPEDKQLETFKSGYGCAMVTLWLVVWCLAAGAWIVDHVHIAIG